MQMWKTPWFKKLTLFQSWSQVSKYLMTIVPAAVVLYIFFIAVFGHAPAVVFACAFVGSLYHLIIGFPARLYIPKDRASPAVVAAIGDWLDENGYEQDTDGIYRYRSRWLVYEAENAFRIDREAEHVVVTGPEFQVERLQAHLKRSFGEAALANST